MIRSIVYKGLIYSGILSLTIAPVTATTAQSPQSSTAIAQTMPRSLPNQAAIGQIVRQDAIQKWRFPSSGRIVRVEATSLRDLNGVQWISPAIPTWKITLESADQRLIYITNETGGVSRLVSREPVNPTVKLPAAVIQAVRRSALSYWYPRLETAPLLPEQILIKTAEPMTWSGGCLGVANPGEGCNKALIPGWRVTVEGLPPKPCTNCFAPQPTPTLTFRVDTTGRTVRADIPQELVTAAATIAQSWGLPANQGRVIGAEPTQWAHGCDPSDRRPRPTGCDPVTLAGWLVKFEHQNQRWLVRIGNQGGDGTLVARENSSVEAQLDASLVQKVRFLAASHWQIQPEQVLLSDIRVKKFDTCLGLPMPGERCTPNAEPGYRVAVAGLPEQPASIYRVSSRSGVRAEAIAGLPPRLDRLPTPWARSLLEEAASRFKINIMKLRITQAEGATKCLPTPMEWRTQECKLVTNNGWKVTISDFRRQLDYHIDDSGKILSVRQK